MTHTITCPECSRQLRVPDDLLGCMVKCPACSHNFDAPSGEPAEPLPQRASPPPRPDKDADRPSSRRRRRDEEDDDRDSKPRPRRFAQEDEDDEDRSIRRRDEKPGKVQAIAIMMLVGGILALIHGVIWAVSVVGLCWPGTYYSVLFGIMAIVKATALLGDKAHRELPPQTIAIMQIINIVVFDVINLTMGIINLVFLSDPEVKRYFRK